MCVRACVRAREERVVNLVHRMVYELKTDSTALSATVASHRRNRKFQLDAEGTRIVLAHSSSDSHSESRRQSAVQADSGSDSDSESRRQSAQRMSFV